MDKIKKAVKSPKLISPLFFLMLLSLLTSLSGAALAEQAPGTSAQSCILVEADSGAVLYEKSADSRMLVASTTKILTALVVLDSCDPRERVIIDKDFPPIEGSSMYIKPGETLTVSELLYGMMLASGNDAATALAIHVSGNVEEFSKLMNKRASGLGCSSSHFVNPHGLDDKNHYSTARDLCIIAREGMKNDTFEEIASTKYITAAGRSLKNHNKLLWSCPGALGIKTGYTTSAGRSLVSCAEREGMRLICVTLNAPDDWNDHSSLYNWAFDNYRVVRVINDKHERLPVISGLKNEAAVRPVENLAVVYPKSDDVAVHIEMPKFVYAPVIKDDVAGVIKVIRNGKTEKEIKLVFAESVDLDKSIPLTRWERLRRMLLGNKTEGMP